MTYGFYRAEALGALATVVIIWYVTGILSYLAVERLHTGQFEIQVGSTDVSFLMVRCHHVIIFWFILCIL